METIDSRGYGQYSTRIHGAYLFHSVPYYSINKSQVSTKEYNKLGQQASAGCIRLAVTDAKWIYDHCRLGTKVVIGEGRTLKKPTRPKVRVSTKRELDGILQIQIPVIRTVQNLL